VGNDFNRFEALKKRRKCNIYTYARVCVLAVI